MTYVTRPTWVLAALCPVFPASLKRSGKEVLGNGTNVRSSAHGVKRMVESDARPL